MHVALTTCTTHSKAKATNTQPPSNAACYRVEHRGQSRTDCSASAPVSWPVAIPRSSFPGPSAPFFWPRGGTKPLQYRAAANPPAVAPSSVSSTYFQVPDGGGGALESAAVPLGTGRARAASSSSPRKSQPTHLGPPSGCEWLSRPPFSIDGLSVGPANWPARPQVPASARVWSDGTVMGAMGRKTRQRRGRTPVNAALRRPPRLRLVRFDG